VLWCDPKVKPLVSNESLRVLPNWNDPACGRDPAEMEHEHRKDKYEIDYEHSEPFDWAGDAIWKEVQKAGIEFVIRTEKRGWRKLSD
jgi:hypothetical protein